MGCKKKLSSKHFGEAMSTCCGRLLYIENIKQINDRLDKECAKIIENKMRKMTEEIQNASGNILLIEQIAQKYTNIIKASLDYKRERCNDLYDSMYEIAHKNNVCDILWIK